MLALALLLTAGPAPARPVPPVPPVPPVRPRALPANRPDSGATSYWQQQVAYRITASLDEPSGVLTGRELITYVNRSPDTLREVYVHDYLNAFPPGSRWAMADSAEGRERSPHATEPTY